MHKAELRAYLPAAILLLGFSFVLNTRSQSAIPLAAPLTTVLPEFADYRVTSNKISDDERRVVGMSDYVARGYYHGTDMAFSTYIGYYERQSQGKTIHSPRNCLPGAGWEILKVDTALLTAGGTPHVVNKYLLKNGSAQVLVYYWYQGRGRVVANEYAVKWNLLRDATLEGHTEEALVRIVIPILGARSMTAPQLQQALASAQELGLAVGNRLVVDVARALPSPAADLPQRTALKT